MNENGLLINNVEGASSLALATGSLENYLRWVNQVPLLTYEEEVELVDQLINNGDAVAGRRLVLSHLRFVVKIARGYLGYGLALADLIQEGTLGLIKAVKRFDPSKKVRLVTFALHWIKAEIHDFILRNWRIVKIATTKAQRKLFFNLRRQAKTLAWFTDQEVKSIAKDLSVPEKEVRTMEARLYNGGDLSLDLPTEEGSNVAPVEYLIKSEEVDYEDKEEQNKRLSQLKELLQDLDPRSKDIVEQRWLSESKVTLQSLADKYQVSCERIRQIEEKAMLSLRNAMV